MKKSVIVLSMFAAIGLAACSHENPLETHSQEDSIKFIEAASGYAETKSSYKSIDPGYAYYWCMKGKLNKDPSFCSKIYEGMVDYAKKSKSDFSDISVEDLKDKKVFDSAMSRSAYAFNAIPIA